MRSFAPLSIALALTILLAPAARGQTAAASVAANGQVSEAVFVSIAPGAQLSGETLPLTYSNLDRQTVRLSIDASGIGSDRRINIPLQLRSNVGYTLSAATNLSGATLLRGLCVRSVRATGRHVAGGAVNAVRTATCEDGTAGVQGRNAHRSMKGLSSPANLLQGQLISLSGTADSPFNALEVLIELEVETQVRWQPQGSIELILSASPRSLASVLMNDGRKP
ncbi:MAG TPA: hypothetical protein VGB76_14195 [Pyrinomonadaceae bacterium]|jgi:hypothetical protein